MMKSEVNKKETGGWLYFVILQVMNILFSLDNVILKYASVSWETNGLWASTTLLYIVLAVGILGVYAVIWQMILGKVKLSVAYLSKGSLVFWGLVWAWIFFKERITMVNIIGTIIIFVGIIMVNENE